MAVNTVFGRSGDVVAQSGDYATFYAPNGAHLPAGGLATQVLTKLSNTNFDTAWVSAVGGVVGSDTVAGTVLLSVPPVDPNNPIAFGQNDPVVERTSNKVTTLVGATDTKYPSALLVSTLLDGKLPMPPAPIPPGTNTKITYDANGLVTAGVAATTADIADSTNKRYVMDSHIVALGGLSGTNSGDQDLSGYATVGALATTNANVAALSGSLSGYATTADLAATNTNVAANTANFANFATTTSLATTNTNVSNLATTVSANYTLQTDHDSLQTEVDGLSSTVSGSGIIVAPATIKLTDVGAATAPIVLKLEHDLSSGAPLAGHGTTLEFRGRTSSTAGVTQGTIRTEWTDPANATRSARMVIGKVLNGATADAFWFRPDGSFAVGTNLGGGFGTVWAQSGFQTSGGSIEGQVLRYSTSSNSFVASLLDLADTTGQYASCNSFRAITVDQTGVAETSHFLFTPVDGNAVGTAFRVTVWGNMDNGTTAVTYTGTLRWGTLGGPVIISVPIVGTTTALTNKSWRLEFLVVVTSVGASGSVRACVFGHEHTSNSLGQLTTFELDTGGTDVGSVPTGATTSMVFSWTMSTTTGTPHVRTLGGIGEVVRQQV